jgi:hypothetical protein
MQATISQIAAPLPHQATAHIMPTRHLRYLRARPINLGQNPKLVLVTPTAATLYARDDFQFAIPVRNATLKSDGKIRWRASFGEMGPRRMDTLRRAVFVRLRGRPVNRSAPKTPGNLPLSGALGEAESTARMGTGGGGATRYRRSPGWSLGEWGSYSYSISTFRTRSVPGWNVPS